MSAVELYVSTLQVGQRVLDRASVLHQPARKLLDCRQVVVAGLRSEAFRLLAHLSKSGLDTACRQVRDELEFAEFDDLPRPCNLQNDVCFRTLPRAKNICPCRQVVRQRRLAMIVES